MVQCAPSDCGHGIRRAPCVEEVQTEEVDNGQAAEVVEDNVLAVAVAAVQQHGAVAVEPVGHKKTDQHVEFSYQPSHGACEGPWACQNDHVGL